SKYWDHRVAREMSTSPPPDNRAASNGKMMRAVVTICGISLFVLVLYVAADWEIARDLLGRGYVQSGPYWKPARGMGLAWGTMFAALGILAYVYIVIWAASVRALSTRRLTWMQCLATVLTLLALHAFESFGVLLGTPLTTWLSYRLVRSHKPAITVAAE